MSRKSGSVNIVVRTFIAYNKRQLVVFAGALALSACQTAPPINVCPPPPDAAMVPAANRPKLDPALAKPFPGVSGVWIGARDTYAHIVAVEAYGDATAARLTALQDWGKSQCRWQASQAPGGR